MSHCNVEMREVRRNDVLVDVCPQCHGAWLDKGELDKLVRSARELTEGYAAYEQDLEHYYRRDGKPFRKKRKWSDLFDIFD